MKRYLDEFTLCDVQERTKENNLHFYDRPHLSDPESAHSASCFDGI